MQLPLFPTIAAKVPAFPTSSVNKVDLNEQWNCKLYLLD